MRCWSIRHQHFCHSIPQFPMRYLIALFLCCSTLMAKPPIGYNDPTIGGLVGWWTMNEGTGTVTTADLSGNGNTGYLTNSPAWTNGVVGGALKFNGSSTSIQTSLNTSNYLQITYCAWVKYVSSANIASGFIATSDGASGNGGFGLATDGSGKFYAACNNGYQGTTTSIVTNTWYFVCGSATNTKAGNVFLYINGVIRTDPVTNLITSVGNYTPLSIGMRSVGVNPNYTSAIIDDVRIYNRALSSDEILKLYNGGYGSQK